MKPYCSGQERFPGAREQKQRLTEGASLSHHHHQIYLNTTSKLLRSLPQMLHKGNQQQKELNLCMVQDVPGRCSHVGVCVCVVQSN